MTDNEWPSEGSHAATTLPRGSDNTNSAKAETAKNEAAGVARDAAGTAQHVAQTAKSEAAGVASEAASSARDLLDQARSDLTEQAGAQQQKVAEGLRSMAGELQSMADGSEQSGVATDLVRQAAERSSSVASWLDNRTPGSLVDEVKSFARQRPVAFLAIAAGAGFLAGRLNKGLSAGTPDTAPAPPQTAGNHPAGTVTTPETIYPPEPTVQPTHAGTGDAAPGGAATDPFGGEPTVPAGMPPVSDGQLPGSGTRAGDSLGGGRH